MNKQQGFALVGTLIVMVVMVVLSIGTSYVTQMNLKIAENERSSAVAKHNAEAGLEISALALAKVVNSATGFPPAFTVPTVSGGNYRPYTGDGQNAYTATDSNGDGFNEYANLRIEGFTASEGSFVKEVLFSSTAPPFNPLFSSGIVSEELVNMTTSLAETDIWASGIKLKSGGVFDPMYSGKAKTFCDAGGACTVGVDPPDVPEPVFSDLRDQVMANHPACSDPVNAALNTMVGVVNDPQNRVICVPAGMTLTVMGTAKNVAIIGTATSQVFFNADAESATSDPNGHGVTIASGFIGLDNTSTNLGGTNTFIAKNSINFAKGVLSSDSTSHTLVVSEGAIAVTGNGGESISYVTFWAGTYFKVSGSSDNFRGSILAQSHVGLSGRAGKVMQGDTDNPYVPRVGDPTTKVESKR